MAQSESRGAKGASSTPNLIAGDLLEFGGKRVEALMDVQKKLLETFEQINRDRLARLQQETELASAFAGKLTSARSIPDVMSAYQEWAAKRMEMFADDSRKMFDDSQKVFNATTKLMSNGGGGPGT